MSSTRLVVCFLGLSRAIAGQYQKNPICSGTLVRYNYQFNPKLGKTLFLA
jgi:hypothetical protein